MEKLSSILPSNPRIKSVDLKDAKPVRPGAPSYGIPVGTNSVQDRVTIRGQDIQESMTYRNPKEMRSAKIAEEVTRKFFENRIEKPMATSEEVNETINEVPEIEAAPVNATTYSVPTESNQSVN